MNNKLKVFIVILLTLSLKSTAQNIVTNEILQRVFYVKFGNETATCFLISINKSDYLVTAKHLFPTLTSKSSVEVQIFKNKGWAKLNCELLTHSNPNVDIAVLNLKTHDQPDNLFDMSDSGYFVSEECFFLGFPFGMKMDDNTGNMNNGYPLPFVKKAIVSAFVRDSTSVTQIFLDGHNNPGFSGSPVVINNPSNSVHRMTIIGVVSAYVNQNKIVQTPMGSFVNSENSGIVVCYSIKHVFEIIDQNK